MLKHEHIIVKTGLTNPPKNNLNDEHNLLLNLKIMIFEMGMKIQNGPIIWYCTDEGNRGYTSVGIITTSHFALHIWDEVEPAIMQFDLYTCKELKVEPVVDFCRKYGYTEIEYKLLDREKDLKVVQEGKIC